MSSIMYFQVTEHNSVILTTFNSTLELLLDTIIIIIVVVEVVLERSLWVYEELPRDEVTTRLTVGAIRESTTQYR